jgi:hypothetical protein
LALAAVWQGNFEHGIHFKELELLVREVLSLAYQYYSGGLRRGCRSALEKPYQKDSADTSTRNTPPSNSVQISWKILLKILLKILPTIRERSVEW